MRRTSAVLAFWLASLGCTTSPYAKTVSPSGSLQEAFILGECKRFAAQLRLDVGCSLSDTFWLVDPATGAYAAGWYNQGTAYFYQPWVQQQEDFSKLSYVAAHEVCHAKNYHHNATHEECIQYALGG